MFAATVKKLSDIKRIFHALCTYGKEIHNGSDDVLHCKTHANHVATMKLAVTQNLY